MSEAFSLPGRRGRSNEDEYVYKYQTTLTVTGFDESHWTEFEVFDGPNLMTEQRHDHCRSQSGLSTSEAIPDKAVDPRLYFLSVWEKRITCTIRELEDILVLMERATKQ